MTSAEVTSLPKGCRETLSASYDAALVDLDGVVYVGPIAVAGAPEALATAREAGMRVTFVTNNASRPPDVVAAHLCDLDVAAAPEDVVTSAQAAARVVATHVPAQSAVLVIGGRGLEEALTELGLRPVRSVDDGPAAVVQGFSPEVGWRDLAEGTLGVLRGLPWVASNLDRTIPTPRGIAPGNGTLVAAIESATGATPVVAGKPELPLHEEAVRRTGARRPLVVGDRLDTDIDGANRAGVDSLLVLTGVCTPHELLLAPPELRPTYISETLSSGLNSPHPEVTRERGGWGCGGWQAQDCDDELALSGSGDRIDALRALCAAAWARTTSADAADATAPVVTQRALRAAGW